MNILLDLAQNHMSPMVRRAAAMAAIEQRAAWQRIVDHFDDAGLVRDIAQAQLDAIDQSGTRSAEDNPSTKGGK